MSSWLSNYGFIADVCIDSDHRGKGYGKKMLKYAIDFLKEKGASVIYLTVDDDNEVAKSLYKSLGFKEIHPQDATSHYYELVIKDNYYHEFINNTRFYLDLASAATIAVALGVGISSAVGKTIDYLK